MLCTSSCPCDYKGLPPNDPKFVTDATGAVSAPGCLKFEDKKYRFEAILLRGVEAEYKCAGICSPSNLPGFPNLFRFSNVNKKVTGGTCEKHVWPFLE